jgi:hypothetical protein
MGQKSQYVDLLNQMFRRTHPDQNGA